MKPIEGRLQTAEHILAKVIETKISDAKVGIAKFTDEKGLVEFLTESDLRNLNKDELQETVNNTINKHLKVTKTTKKREEITDVDLSKVPEHVTDIRIVEIEGFDKRPCRDPHVDNTKQIGKLLIEKIERVGKDRYRFTLKVENLFL